MRRIATLGLLLSTAGVVLSSSAQAQSVTTFTSRQAWQAAVAANWQFTENVQSITQDTYFQTNALNVGPFSLQQAGQDPSFGLFRNFIDVPPLQFADNDGLTSTALYLKSGVTSVNMTFGAQTFAWGGDFFGAQTGELVSLALISSGGSVVANVPVTVNTGFFGFVLSPAVGISKIAFTSRIANPDPSVGQGFGLENVTGAYTSVPVAVPSAQISVTASGLAFSRVTQTFNGTVTLKNVGITSISGPFQIVFSSVPAGVTLLNAAGVFSGSPFISLNVAGLAGGQSTTATVQFSNPSNTAIKLSPVAYSGGFN